MAAPLSTCTVEAQRSVICFLWSEGVKPSAINYVSCVCERLFSLVKWCKYMWGAHDIKFGSFDAKYFVQKIRGKVIK